MRSAGIILAIISSVVLNATAQANTDESIVCKNLRQCVDIVERHAPDSFDYHILNSEFQRFGAKGKAALLNMLASKDETDMRRAQAVLARGRTLLTPDEQRKVAALWPRGDLDTHAKIMKNALSPLIRARMIETLSHEDPKVRKISRDIIAMTVSRKMDFPLRPDEYGPLAKALITEPTSALVELFSNFEIAKTKPIYMRLLRSTDGPTLSAAYNKLYEDNKEDAFKALVATLYALKDNQSDAAFAMSHTLQERHKSREDGFYLKFAKDLAEDSDMSLMGRLAGFDAIMQSKNAPRLSEPRKYSGVIKTALQSHSVLPAGYLRNLPIQAGEASDIWLAAYWDHLKPRIGEEKLDFIRIVGDFETSVAENILMDALSDQGDWRIIQVAALPLGQRQSKRAISKLEELSDHPIIAVQIAALTALDGINLGSLQDRSAFWQNKLSRQYSYCTAKPKNFKDDAKGLPFFDLVNLDFKVGGDKRRFVSTAAPTRKGFLVGFDAGVRGGDLRYYDNASGKSLPLKPQLSNRTDNITAIIPVTPPPLGTYAKTFWIIAQNKNKSDQAKLYRLSGTDDNFKITYHAELPHRVTTITPQKNGDVFMSFYKDKTKATDVNPPLLLSPNGSIRRACSPPTDTAGTLSKAFP